MQILVSSFIYYPSHLKCLIFSQMHISRKCFVKAQSQSYSHILLDVDFDNANEEKKDEGLLINCNDVRTDKLRADDMRERK